MTDIFRNDRTLKKKKIFIGDYKTEKLKYLGFLMVKCMVGILMVVLIYFINGIWV